MAKTKKANTKPKAANKKTASNTKTNSKNESAPSVADFQSILSEFKDTPKVEFPEEAFLEPLNSQPKTVSETIDQYEKRIYDLQQLLELSRSLCSTLEYTTLIESILYTCMCQMHVIGAGLFILDDLDSNTFNLGSNHTGMDLDPDVNYTIPTDHPVLSILNHHGHAYTMLEIYKQLEPGTNIDFLESLKPSLIVPLFNKNHITGLLVMGERIDLGDGVGYSHYDQEQLISIASLAAIAINNASLLEKSSTDMMTHLKLKYFFYNTLTDKLDLAITQNTPLAVLMFDIDFFKKFNDTWGHECGDLVLKSVAKSIKNNIREMDIASRYGGEEFTVMLPNAARDDALAVAERIRKAIEDADFEYNGQKVHVTISGGVAVYNATINPVSTPKELVNQADQALYVSKRNGRNRITFADAELLHSTEVAE